MSVPAYARAIALLRRAGLLAAILALIAGIFGMHVMTATHTQHSAAVGTHHHSSPAGHAGEQAPGPASAPNLPGDQGDEGTRTVQCTDSGARTGMQAMTAACTPSVKTGSLTAPLPGTGIIDRNINTGTLAAISAQWSYLPGSPSPGELCISRT